MTHIKKVEEKMNQTIEQLNKGRKKWMSRVSEKPALAWPEQPVL